MNKHLSFITFLLFAGLMAGSAIGQDRKMIESGKSASFLVELPSKKGYATAFCIQSSGIFVTNNHVVDAMDIGDSVNLVMNSGSEEQKTISAKVIRRDAKSDLAFLKGDGSADKFTSLKLAPNPNVFETMNVTVFGFPFGVGLALNEDSFPSISVNVGKITAVRRDKKEVQLLQLDATLNPGNSGGAVLNESGEVIGVVSFGVAGSGVNFAIPVEKLSQFLLTPDVEMKVPTFSESNFTQPQEVEVVITPFTGDLKEASVEFWLRKGAEKPQKFDLPKKVGNRYLGIVQGVDVTAKKALNGKFEFANGKIEAKITDDKLMVGGKELYLSDIRLIETLKDSDHNNAKVSLANGETENIEVKQLPTVKIDLGNYPVSINLAKVIRFELEKEEDSESITYIVIVKNAGKEVYRSTLSEAMEDATNVAASPSNNSNIFSSNSRKPSPLEDAKKRIPLPGTITDVVQARGGEFLLITLGTDKKLVVIDLVSASIAKILPLSSDDVVVAGTMDHIVVMDRTRNIFERYTINGFKREAATKPQFSGVVKSITAGSASQGPILVHRSVGTDALAQASFVAMDLKSFKELPIATKNSGQFSSFRDFVHVRASSNGRVFGMWATSHSPQGIQSVVLTEKQMLVKYEHDSAGHVVPSADGTHLLTGARGVFTAGLKSLAKNASRSSHVPCAPTSHPRFYITIPASPGAQINMGSDAYKGVRAGVHELGSEAALLDLPDLLLNASKATDDGSWAKNDLSLDKRVFLNLSLSRLVSVPFTNDSIVLQEFNFNKELKKSGLDYFFVSSTPVRTFAPEKTYSYQVAVESNKNKLKFELASGPEKMEITSKGKVTWKVPADFKEETVDVIISVSNGESMQTYDTFTIYRSE